MRWPILGPRYYRPTFLLGSFNRLRDRVTALEINIGDWSRVVSSMQKSVYAVMHIVAVDDERLDFIFTFIGTGFAVNQGTIVTNGSYHRCSH